MSDIQAWDIGDDFPDEIRRLVDAQVREAVVDYVKGGMLHVDYRKGGSPTVAFTPAETLNEEVHLTVDLGDLLFEELEGWDEEDEHPMPVLVAALLKTYNNRRLTRSLDPGSSIPEPSNPKWSDDE